MPSVLFVCTANINRSPMAAAILRYKAAQEEPPGEWRIESAGTWTEDGMPVASKVQEVVKARLGMDLSSERSRIVTQALVRQFDLILVMEQGHKEALRAEFPEVAGRVHLLAEMIDRRHNIHDPLGGPLSEFEDLYAELDGLISEAYPRIRQAGTA